MGGIARFTPEELTQMRIFDLDINRQFYVDNQRMKRHRISYQKRYDKAHKEEIKVKQHEYYLKRKAATRQQSDNGANQNISLAL